MRSVSRLLILIAALAATPCGAAPEAAPQPVPSKAAIRHHYPQPTPELVARLTHGGYVLVFRHEKTDFGQKDAAGLNFADRSAQRNLSDEGRKEAMEVGKAIASLRIPVGTVLASPMWRCRDTAMLEFGRGDTTMDLFQKGPASRQARIRMLSTPPKQGTNTVLVTHQDLLLPITKLARDELVEGDALVVQPLGHDSFRVLAQITPADWNRLTRSRKL